MNDNEIISFDIINGQKSDSSVTIAGKSSGYPCSYAGIQDCAQDAIDDWHPITAVIWAFGALACIGEEVAICISENCIEN